MGRRETPKSSVTRFSLFALWVSERCAEPRTLVLAVASVGVWGLFGPFCGWDNTWQLVINTATTIVNFLLMFVLSNAEKVNAHRHDAKMDGQDAKLDRILELLEAERKQP